MTRDICKNRNNIIHVSLVIRLIVKFYKVNVYKHDEVVYKKFLKNLKTR